MAITSLRELSSAIAAFTGKDSSRGLHASRIRRAPVAGCLFREQVRAGNQAAVPNTNQLELSRIQQCIHGFPDARHRRNRGKELLYFLLFSSNQTIDVL